LITPDADIWADANAEVDAVLEETDDEDDDLMGGNEDGDGDGFGVGWRTDGSGARYISFVPVDASADLRGFDSTTPSPSPNSKGKKRARSSSFSDSGRLSSPRGGRRERGSARVDDAQSPLVKRKKLSAARRGSSRLKVGLSAEDLHDDDAEEREESDGDEVAAGGVGGDAESDSRQREERESAASTDGNGEENDEEDDFLAREMAEEWG